MVRYQKHLTDEREKMHMNQEEEKMAEERVQKHHFFVKYNFFFFNSLAMKILFVAQPTCF